jgi:hypothetical protein
MKRIFIISVILFSWIIAIGQTPTAVSSDKTTLKSGFAITSISSTDTTFPFTYPYGVVKAYSIHIILTDTVENTAGAGVGAFLQVSNDGSNWVQLGDSAAFAKDTYPLSRFFSGTYFPYTFGRVKIMKRDAIDGDFKIIVNTQF